MSLKLFTTIFVTLLVSNKCVPRVAGNAVLISPLTGEGSHYYVARSIANELLRRGHTVTMLLDDRFEFKFKDGQSDTDFVNIENVNFKFYKSNFTLTEYYYVLGNMTKAGLRGRITQYMIDLVRSNHFQK